MKKMTIILVTVVLILLLGALWVSFDIQKNLNNYYFPNKTETSGEQSNTFNPYGTWAWKSDDGSSTFSLTIKQGETSNSIVGDYCAVYDFGNRIDCGEDTKNESIIGTISGNEAELTFTSWYWGETGKAIILNDKEGLRWKVIEGSSYFPLEALLVRQQ